MPLYKYLEKEHLESFFSTGLIKIGSLYGYRKAEEFGEFIGDKDEGLSKTILTSVNQHQFALNDSSPEANFILRHLDVPPERHHVQFQLGAGTQIIASNQSPDYYIYCVSSQFNKETMEKSGYDSCIEILDVEAFFKKISKKIKHKATYQDVCYVNYQNRETDHLNPHFLPPALIKDTKYAFQKEVRALWNPKKEIKKPLYINVKDAIRFCRVYPV